MATIIGQGIIEVVPRLVPTFGPQLSAQMAAGTAVAGAAATKQAEAAGAASGKGFLGGMRSGLAGMSGMIKGVVGVAAAVGIVEFAKASVDAFKNVSGESLALQRVMGGTIEAASGWRAVGERFGLTSGQMSVAMKTLAKDVQSGKGPIYDLGITTKDAHGQLLPMGDVMLQLADKFKAMPDGIAKTRLAQELFGRGGLALIPIMNKGGDGIRELMDKYKQMGLVLDGDATDKTKKLKAAQMDLSMAAEGVKVQFGEKLIPVLVKFYQFLAAEVIPKVAALLGFLERNGEAVKIFGSVLLGLLVVTKSVAAAQSAWNAILVVYRGVAAAATVTTRALGVAITLATSPIGLIVIGIGAAVAAIILLWKHWDEVWNWIGHHKAYAIIIGILGAAIIVPIFALVAAAKFLWANWDKIWKDIQGAFAIVAAYVVAGLQTLQRVWNTVWAAFSVVIGPVWNAIKTAVSIGMTVVQGAISAGMTVVRTVWNAAWTVMSTLVTAAWNVIRPIVQAGMTVISTVISAGMTVVRAVWSAAWAVMSTLLSAAWTVIRPIVQAGMTVIQTAISVGMTVVRTLWQAGWAVMSTLLSAAWTVIRPIVQAGMTVIQTAISVGMTVIRTLWQAAWAVLSTLVTAAWNVIRPIVQTGMTVLQTVISAGMTVIRTVWNAAWTVISTLMTAVWTTIKAVVSAGVLVVRTVIEAAWKVVQGIFQTVWGLIVALFKANWIAMQLVVSAAVSAISTAISTAWNAVRAAWIVVWNAISTFFNTLWAALKLIVGAATSWIRDTINTVWTFVKNNVFAPIWNAISTAFNTTWAALKLIVGLATAWIRDTINTVWNFVKNNIFAPIWNAISTAFNTTWNGLKLIVGTATGWIRDTITSVWNAVKNNVFAPIWNAISTAFHTTWEGIKTTANNAINWVHDRIKTVLDTIGRVWSDAWNGMKNVLGGIWDGIKTAIRTPVNAIISGLNHFFDPINTVIDWAIGKKPLPHIDPVGMATGGRLPGYGGGDTVPALLEPGEAVIPKHLVPDIAAWARDKHIPGFQTGIAIPPLPTTPTQIGQPPTAIGQGSGNLSGVQTKPDPGIGILGDIVSGIGSAASAVASGIGGVAGEIAGMVGDAAKWVWAKGSGFFQLGAGLLAQGMADAAKKAIDVATGPLGQPGAVFNAVADKTIQTVVDWIKGKESAPPSAGGPGYSISGNWAPSIRPWVDYIARSNNVSANTYAGHHPAENFAVDLAIGQGGMVNTAPATGPTGNDLYSKLARWVDDHIINVPSPGWYVGTHAAIHSRGGAWHPAGDQVGRRGQTYAHDDHVHVSFDPRGRGPLIGVPGNYSVPGFTWDENGNPPVVAIPAANAAAVIGAAVGGFPWNQSQMEQAMLAVGAPANIAHIFGAIGMNENPASRPVHNQYGWFDSVWALIRSWTTSVGYDTNRLNSDIVYAAGAAYRLYQMSGFNPWEAYTNGNYLRNMMLGGLVKSYDAGGWLPPGLSLAYNGTGRPESVGGPVQNTVNLTINVANGDPVTIRTVAQQVVDDALTQLARKLSSGAGRN